MANSEQIQIKKRRLMDRIENCGSLLIAFSGGVDSTFLLAVAHEVLSDKVVAATADSSTFPSKELNEAKSFTLKWGIEHIIFKANELSIAEFVSNNPNRCYHCKKHLSSALIKIAQSKNINCIAYGANFDDLGDYRPGMDAAREAGIIAPLVEAKLNKAEIRLLSKEIGLHTWNKSAKACLASRIPYGTPITKKNLEMISDGEKLLSDLGFRQYRVRYHGSTARIEVEEDEIEKIFISELRLSIIRQFKEIGFKYVSIDLEGYVSGSMNKVLSA